MDKRTHITDYKTPETKQLGWEVELVANFKFGDYNQYKLTRNYKNGKQTVREVLVNKFTNKIEEEA